MSEDFDFNEAKKEWNRASKEEKDQAKAAMIQGGGLLLGLFWSALTTAGKWSVARYWIFLFLWAMFIRPMVDDSIGYMTTEQFNTRKSIETWVLCYLVFVGPAILYIFRKKFFQD